MKKNCVLLLVIVFFSCSRSKPEITFGFLQLVQYQTETGIQEHFTFFILPKDEDGIENLDKIYLYHDKDQLRWQINSNEWISYIDDGKTWIGTRSITVQQGNLPRGVFRAVLVNKGGESSERNFTFDANARFPFPELSVSGGYYTINSAWPQNRLICYDSSGTAVLDMALTSFAGSVPSLNLPSNVSTVSLWADDEENFYSACTNMVPVK